MTQNTAYDSQGTLFLTPQISMLPLKVNKVVQSKRQSLQQCDYVSVFYNCTTYGCYFSASTANQRGRGMTSRRLVNNAPSTS